MDRDGYRPAFKLVMVGNHRPAIQNPDDAMRRRLHLLPMTFQPQHRDKLLQEDLLAELPGILKWAVEGCLAWQREGLGMPKVVREATEDYFAEQDIFKQWLGERCDQTDGRAEASSSALYQNWMQWAQARGESPGSQKNFSAKLERHHAKKHTNAGRVFIGLRLRSNAGGVW